MARIFVVTPDKAKEVPLPSGISGDGQSSAYLDPDQFPLRLHLHRLGADEEIQIGPMDCDCVAFVWHGAAHAGGHALDAGSSVIAEKGKAVLVKGVADETEILVFASSAPVHSDSPGGHVHILPAGLVPRSENLGGGTDASGALHADSDCDTCDVWLHENRFPGSAPLSDEEQARGIHSHTEDEIIFVTSGQMRLGNKLVGPGTALAIAADTLYSFTPGPDGLSFVNFRASMPGDIRFANGPSISETQYWRDRLPRPEYLEPAG